MTTNEAGMGGIASLSGSDWWNVPASAGVPAIKVTDGPSGARGELFAGGPPSVSFPCGAALGATWDVDLVERVGAALAAEARAKGAHVLLGPTVNLHRSPLGGRHFECFAEDPVLTALLAAAYVAGIQDAGVAACVKHLVANDIETDRFEISSEPDERTLREVSLLPFEHALRGVGAWSTMGAYNRLHGTHCCERPELLTTILRDEWGWDGVVISDWFATRSTVASAESGLDLEMPGPPIHWGPKLAAAVESGEVAAEVIEAKLARLALLAARAGADQRPPGVDGPGGAADVVAVAREAAAAATVLLKNDAVQGEVSAGAATPALPFPADIGRLAVVGPNADREVIQGGGSARVTPTAVATVADGLRARLGDRVVVEPGVTASRGTAALDGRDLHRADGTPGVDVEVLDDTGALRVALRPREFRVVYLDTPAPGEDTIGWSIRASAMFRPMVSGAHRFKVRTNATAILLVDGVEPGDDGLVELEAGRDVELVMTCRADVPGLRVSLELRCGRPDDPSAFQRAVTAAADADAAVVVVGLDGDWETEGRDRDDLSLPGHQVDLIRSVAAVQPRTVVAVIAGSPVDLAWVDDVPAILWCWYPGQEGGHAIADVVLGDVDPGGRLPCTMPKRLEDTPAFLDVPPEPGVLRYQEGVFCGHRWYDARLVDPAFPFGHGLSYAAFVIGAPSVSTATLEPGDTVDVEVDVTNTGNRRGSEVVQLYVADAKASVRRPPRELRGFAKVALDPGETSRVLFTLEMRDLAFWDRRAHGWRAEAGSYAVHVGRSSRDLPGIAEFELTADWMSGP